MKLDNNNGDSIVQPTPHDIGGALLQMFRDRDNDFVVLEDSDNTDFYIQAVPMSETAAANCRVEYRDPISRRHFAADNIAVNKAIALFQQFNRREDTFRRAVAWRDVSDEFTWND